MKLRLPIFFLLSFLLLSFFPTKVRASGFQIKSVGNLDVDGAVFKHLWYTNGKINITGIALANTSVTAIVDSTNSTVTADASGNWNYQTDLAGGDHQISFSSSGSTIAFTLTIGSLPEGAGSLQKAETPSVGIITPTFIILAIGSLFLLTPFFLRKVYLRV